MDSRPPDLIKINYSALKKQLSASHSDQVLFQAIVNSPFKLFRVEMALMFLGIIVLLQIDPINNTVDRITLSDTILAKDATDVSVKAFENIRIPRDFKNNLINRTIETGQPHGTSDWEHLFAPELSPEAARLNQASGGISFSAVYPLKARHGGAMIFSFFQYPDKIGENQKLFMKRYCQLVDDILARQ